MLPAFCDLSRNLDFFSPSLSNWILEKFGKQQRVLLFSFLEAWYKIKESCYYIPVGRCLILVRPGVSKPGSGARSGARASIQPAAILWSPMRLWSSWPCCVLWFVWNVLRLLFFFKGWLPDDFAAGYIGVTLFNKEVKLKLEIGLNWMMWWNISTW